MTMLNMQLGEVAPGGTGSGLYGMLVLAVITVFVAGLMVGRTPEYLGKKIDAARDQVRVALLPDHAADRAGRHRRSRWRCPANGPAMLNTGPHGLSEVLYAFTSAANNNGSAFAGHQRQHRRGTTPRSAWRCCSAGSCRWSSCSALAGSLARQGSHAGVGRHAAHPPAAVRRDGRRRHGDRGRADLLPRARARAPR